MLQLLQIIFVLIIFISTSLLVYESILSRRQSLKPILRFRHRARMNIQMGICFITLASLQLTLQSGHPLRYGLIGFIYLIGLINLYYGIKRNKWSKGKEAEEKN